jgi:hypothetical protein
MKEEPFVLIKQGKSHHFQSCFLPKIIINKWFSDFHEIAKNQKNGRVVTKR